MQPCKANLRLQLLLDLAIVLHNGQKMGQLGADLVCKTNTKMRILAYHVTSEKKIVGKNIFPNLQDLLQLLVVLNHNDVGASVVSHKAARICKTKNNNKKKDDC